jgi:Ni/Co efflux regulator RcnB
MQSRKSPRVSLFALALAAPVLVHAAPPTVNDDSRVGAPPVIVARPKAAVPVPAPPIVSAPVVAAPIRRLPPQASIPASRSKAIPSPEMTAPPMPRQAMTSPSQHGTLLGPDRGRSDWVEVSRPEAGQERSSYQRPSYGYQLPSEWVAPHYFIADFYSYGLSPPASGFGWSRYYDDAVLTDQWGRVYDWRDDVNWADHDERYVGTGGGNYRDERHDRHRRDKKYAYKGRWTGSWDGGRVQSYQGEWRGSVRPHWNGGGYDVGNRSVSYNQSYGYDGGGTTVTTVVVNTGAPVMTTRTISYDVVSYVPVRKKVIRRYKPRPKPACACGS